VVPFSAQRCGACDVQLAYVSDEREIRALRNTADPVVYEVPGHTEPVWRCLNTAWGCNWLTTVASANEWCRACRLTRGRPDTGRSDATEAWAAAESVKRRLLHQLDELSLPIEPRSTAAPDGLAFDLVYLPGEGGITGHLDGVVTLDLAEVDDRLRDDLRRRLGEPFRTVIGHLRHEIGHYYWGRLIAQTNEIGHFRHLFGDERAEYRAAMERYYGEIDDTWDSTRFVSPYAASHPLEDWAETFAHYLHIVDAVDTAIAHQLLTLTSAPASIRASDAVTGIDRLLDAWRPINDAVNAIADALGAPALYPFDPTGVVIDKLALVHQQVTAHTERTSFYERL